MIFIWYYINPIGFTYCTFTQFVKKDTNFGLEAFNFIYFAFTALTMAIGVHVIFSTVLLTVFGSGLAIIGPLGSMARSAKGLQMEQEHVIISFIAMMLSFALSTVLVFWVIMDYPPAFICTSTFLVSAYMWYSTCERMYLRFYWNKEDSGWQRRNNEGDDDDIDDDDEPKLPEIGNTEADTVELSATATSKDKKKTSFFTTLKKRVGINSVTTYNTDNATGSGSLPSELGSGTGKKSVMTEGYLSIKRESESAGQVQENSTKWKRQYFVLFRNGCLYTYRTRLDYRNDPSSPKYTRPIKISEYSVEVQNLDLVSRSENDAVTSGRSVNEHSDTRSVASGITVNTFFSSASTSVMSRFLITLTPVGNSSSSNSLQDDGTMRTLWLLRSDTEEEQDIWVESIRAVSPNSFPSSNL